MAVLPVVQSSKLGQLAVGVLIIIWVFWIAHNTNSLANVSSLIASSSSWDKLSETKTAVTAALGGYDAADAALVDLCHKTKWQEGLWLTCHAGCGPHGHSICGGLNNGRNRVQTCVRMAIDMGASIKFPLVTDRDEHNLVNTGTTPVCPGKWFDMEALAEKLGTLCPRMRISPCDEDSADIKPERVVDLKRIYEDEPFYNNTFSDFVNATLAAQGKALTDASAENPMMLRFSDSYVGWDYRRSGESDTVRKALVRTLTFNATLSAISDDIFASKGLRGGNYFGIHWRAESDWPVGWGTAEQQVCCSSLAQIPHAPESLKRKNG